MKIICDLFQIIVIGNVILIMFWIVVYASVGC